MNANVNRVASQKTTSELRTLVRSMDAELVAIMTSGRKAHIGDLGLIEMLNACSAELSQRSAEASFVGQ